MGMMVVGGRLHKYKKENNKNKKNKIKDKKIQTEKRG
jgi:hypothetical protein